MIVRMLHKLASAGPVYDLIQNVAGVKYVYGRFAKLLATQDGYRTVLDIGGGTGRIREQLAPDCLYFCLDNEEPKLVQLKRRGGNVFGILGDATRTPIASGSMDLVLCLAVSHHLNDAELQRTVLEANRILRPGGRLLFYDALWQPGWWPGRFVWSIDRGSNPRTKDALLNAIGQHMRIVHQERFRLLHEYLLILGSKD